MPLAAVHLLKTLQFAFSSGSGSIRQNSQNSSAFRRLYHFRFFSSRVRRLLAAADELMEDFLALFMPATAAFLLVALSPFVLLSSYTFYQEGKPPLVIAHLLLETPPFMFFVMYALRQAVFFLKVFQRAERGGGGADAGGHSGAVFASFSAP